MNKPDEQFDEKLSNHFKARKARTTLSHAQQQALKHRVAQKQPKKLGFALQLTSLTCAQGLLAFIVLDSNNVINTAPKTVLNTIDIHDYSFITTHEIDQTGSYASAITQQKRALDPQLANDLRRHQQRHQGCRHHETTAN